MKENASTVIHGRNLILVPYRKEHVPKYHTWMQSEELLEKTASERLSLEQEYEMQQKWHNDADKCTFIILAKALWKKNRDEIESMVGDVNLFLNNPDDITEAEIEVMVAESASRGCGIGTEAVLAMLYYGNMSLGIKKFNAIVGNDNKESIALFLKMGFAKIKETGVFNQSTFEIEVSQESFHDKFSTKLSCLCIATYPIEQN